MAFGKRAGLALAALMLDRVSGARASCKQYEYDERVELSLDGSAVVDINASIPALVALRGATLSVDPEARFDRQALPPPLRGPGVTVREVSAFRRHGRRFVHVRLDVSDIAALPRLAPLSWSRYRLDRLSERIPLRAGSRPAAQLDVGDVGWTGNELVAFRVHPPSRINFHNSPLRCRARQHPRLGTDAARSPVGRALAHGSAHADRVDSLPHALALRGNVRRRDGWCWPPSSGG